MFNQPMYWLLDEQGNPYPSNDSHAANEQLKDGEKRRVAIAERNLGKHAIEVSTVFLTIDHNHRITPEERASPPILFETMLFVDDKGILTQRYATREEAQAGHDEMVVKLDELLATIAEADVVKIGDTLRMISE